jgi:hypothetical protein
VFRDEAVKVIDSPGSVIELSDVYIRLDMRSSLRARRNTHGQPSDAGTIIIANGCLITKAHDVIYIQILEEHTPGRFLFSCLTPKSAGKGINEGRFQKGPHRFEQPLLWPEEIMEK